MGKYIIIIALVAANIAVCSQTVQIALSPNHQKKISSIESGHKRMVKFYKFYKKDSARHVKSTEKHYKKLLDSAWHAKRKNERIEKKLAKKGVISNRGSAVGNSDDLELKKWKSILNDPESPDSVKILAKERIKNLTVEHAKQYPGFQHLMEKHRLSGDSVNWQELSRQVPGLDSLSDVFGSDPNEIFEIAEAKTTQHSGLSSLHGDLAKANKLEFSSDQYQQEYGKYMDKDHLGQEAKDKSMKKAADYLAAHGDKIEDAHAKASKLLSKYREYSNSNDLSDAVKRTSLQGKNFWERIVLGGNFNVVSTKPFSIDLSPQLGYRFNTRFYAGVGMNCRYTFNDTIRHGWYVSPENTALRIFANYDIFKDFYLYGEWERAGLKSLKNDRAQNAWVNNYFIGMGRKFLIYPKLYLTFTALYNLNGQDNNPAYPRRFQIRLGFQTSDLAFRKKKINYDPNR